MLNPKVWSYRMFPISQASTYRMQNIEAALLNQLLIERAVPLDFHGPCCRLYYGLFTLSVSSTRGRNEESDRWSCCILHVLNQVNFRYTRSSIREARDQAVSALA
jgi:hypothetical protein